MNPDHIEHHSINIGFAIIGGAIGAINAKSGHVGEETVKGAAYGLLAGFGLKLLLGLVVGGTYVYAREKYGRDNANEMLRRVQVAAERN